MKANLQYSEAVDPVTHSLTAVITLQTDDRLQPQHIRALAGTTTHQTLRQPDDCTVILWRETTHVDPTTWARMATRKLEQLNVEVVGLSITQHRSVAASPRLPA